MDIAEQLGEFYEKHRQQFVGKDRDNFADLPTIQCPTTFDTAENCAQATHMV